MKYKELCYKMRFLLTTYHSCSHKWHQISKANNYLWVNCTLAWHCLPQKLAYLSSISSFSLVYSLSTNTFNSCGYKQGTFGKSRNQMPKSECTFYSKHWGPWLTPWCHLCWLLSQMNTWLNSAVFFQKICASRKIFQAETFIHESEKRAVVAILLGGEYCQCSR